MRVLGPIYLTVSILYTADLKTLKPTARAVSGHCGAIKNRDKFSIGYFYILLYCRVVRGHLYIVTPS